MVSLLLTSPSLWKLSHNLIILAFLYCSRYRFGCTKGKISWNWWKKCRWELPWSLDSPKDARCPYFVVWVSHNMTMVIVLSILSLVSLSFDFFMQLVRVQLWFCLLHHGFKQRHSCAECSCQYYSGCGRWLCICPPGKSLVVWETTWRSYLQLNWCTMGMLERPRFCDRWMCYYRKLGINSNRSRIWPPLPLGR